MLDVVLIATLE